MKGFLPFVLVIYSCFFISLAEMDSSCDQHVLNERFCDSFESVTKRVIEGPQYRTYTSYSRWGGYTTRRSEIFINRSHILMACDSSNISNFTIRDNTGTPSNYSDQNNTESYECEYKIVDDYSICTNESSSEVVSVYS